MVMVIFLRLQQSFVPGPNTWAWSWPAVWNFCLEPARFVAKIPRSSIGATERPKHLGQLSQGAKHSLFRFKHFARCRFSIGAWASSKCGSPLPSNMCWACSVGRPFPETSSVWLSWWESARCFVDKRAVLHRSRCWGTMIKAWTFLTVPLAHFVFCFRRLSYLRQL